MYDCAIKQVSNYTGMILLRHGTPSLTMSHVSLAYSNNMYLLQKCTLA